MKSKQTINKLDFTKITCHLETSEFISTELFLKTTHVVLVFLLLTLNIFYIFF